MAGGNESDNLSAGEPAICEDVIKVYFSGDETLYHLYHELYLALVILLDTLCCMAVLVTFLLEPSVKLFLLQVVASRMVLLSRISEMISSAPPKSSRTSRILPTVACSRSAISAG